MKKDQSVCPLLPNCLFFNTLSLPTVAETLKDIHCRDRFEKCARYGKRKAGEVVPDNLWPNGKLM